MKTAVGTSDDEGPDDKAAAAHHEDIASLHVAEIVDPVMYVAHPGYGFLTFDEVRELEHDHDQVVADVVKQANAGAALAYALFHAPVAWWTAKDPPMPDEVMRAYVKACEAYGIGR